MKSFLTNFAELSFVALNERIAVIEMDKIDLGSLLSGHRFQQRHCLGNEWMGHLAHRPVDLTVGIKCAVEQQNIGRLYKVFERS